MADLRGVACVACGSETFEETDAGFYVCARCGTQSQDVRKDVDDEAEPSSAAEVQGTASSEDKYFVPLRLACESKLPRVMEVPPPQ